MARSFAGGANTNNIAFANFASHTQRTVFVKFNVTALDTTARRFHEWNSGTLIDSSLITDTVIQYNAGWDSTSGSWTIATTTTGAWHDLVITYNGGATTNDPVFYLDGATPAVTEIATPVGNLQTGNQTLFIGNRQDGTRCFNGLEAEYARWNRILSAGEIALLSKGYAPRFIRSGLVLYSPLIGRASPEPDLFGGKTGTVTGAVAANHPRIIYPSAPQIMKFGADAAPPVVTRFNIMGTVGM